MRTTGVGGASTPESLRHAWQTQPVTAQPHPEEPGDGGGARRALWREWFDRTLPVAAIVGVVVGIAVFAFERAVSLLLDAVVAAPTLAMAVAPTAGIVLAALVLRVGPEPRSRTTADEYIRSIHDPTRRIPGAQVFTRLAAALATLGLGGSLGLEGPAMLIGAGTGDGVARRLAGRVGVDHQALLVAGAAAGVAAVFKAPATGAVFALEVPYRADMARHQLMPALVGAASGYLALVSVAGTERLFAVGDNPPFDLRDLGGALLVGVVGGLLAQAITRAIRWAKHWAAATPAPLRLPPAGLVLALVAWWALVVTDLPLGVGPGYQVLDWLDRPDLPVSSLLALLVIRFLGSVATTAGGGVGGFFVPLVVMGASMGRTVSSLLGVEHSGLFPVLGVAAVLGAGYQVPLAAVMFVAETSGRPGYVVPALLAAVAADLTSRGASVTDYQTDRS